MHQIYLVYPVFFVLKRKFLSDLFISNKTPLHFAGYFPIVKLLVDFGADLNIMNSQYVPRHLSSHTASLLHHLSFLVPLPQIRGGLVECSALQ
jgi:hypothetical protein